jgi:hypothetical protein
VGLIMLMDVVGEVGEFTSLSDGLSAADRE